MFFLFSFSMLFLPKHMTTRHYFVLIVLFIMNIPYVKSNDEFDIICNGCSGNDWEKMLLELSKHMMVYYE